MASVLGRIRRSRLTWLVVAIAFGASLWEFARGVGSLVLGLLGKSEYTFDRPLTWRVGDRILELDVLVLGLVELAVVALVAAVLLRDNGARADAP